MKDKRVKLAGALDVTLQVSSKVGELSDAQRHRAKKAFNGFSWPSGEPSKGSVRKQPRFSQFPNVPRKKCNRPDQLPSVEAQDRQHKTTNLLIHRGST
jgi:hypothetical protein